MAGEDNTRSIVGFGGGIEGLQTPIAAYRNSSSERPPNSEIATDRFDALTRQIEHDDCRPSGFWSSRRRSATKGAEPRHTSFGRMSSLDVTASAVPIARRPPGRPAEFGPTSFNADVCGIPKNAADAVAP
ncbi:MAG: hypothetical protein ACRDD1_13500, partial [Planctomycetia bacterium]